MTQTKQTATRGYEVKITEETIADAIRANSSHCMIAEAIKAQKPHLSHVAVDLATIRVTDKAKGERYIYLTPRSVQQNIVDFDGGRDPQPFTFRLRSPTVIKSNPKKNTKAVVQADHSAAGKKAKRVGGKAPPRMPGNVRVFGVRNLRG